MLRRTLVDLLELPEKVAFIVHAFAKSSDITDFSD